jgi:hypothetical protein
MKHKRKKQCTAHKDPLSVQNRPPTGRLPDGFRTLPFVWDRWDQCPEIVRKSSAYWTTSGRFPDIEVRKSSAWWTGSGRLPDLGGPGKSPGREIAVPQSRRRRKAQRSPGGRFPDMRRTVSGHEADGFRTLRSGSRPVGLGKWTQTGLQKRVDPTARGPTTFLIWNFWIALA